jgi:hypothetical protein
MGGEFEYRDDFLARDRVLLDDFIDGHPILKVFENDLTGVREFRNVQTNRGSPYGYCPFMGILTSRLSHRAGVQGLTRGFQGGGDAADARL